MSLDELKRKLDADSHAADDAERSRVEAEQAVEFFVAALPNKIADAIEPAIANTVKVLHKDNNPRVSHGSMIAENIQGRPHRDYGSVKALVTLDWSFTFDHPHAGSSLRAFAPIHFVAPLGADFIWMIAWDGRSGADNYVTCAELRLSDITQDAIEGILSNAMLNMREYRSPSAPRR